MSLYKIKIQHSSITSFSLLNWLTALIFIMFYNLSHYLYSLSKFILDISITFNKYFFKFILFITLSVSWCIFSIKNIRKDNDFWSFFILTWPKIVFLLLLYLRNNKNEYRIQGLIVVGDEHNDNWRSVLSQETSFVCFPEEANKSEACGIFLSLWNSKCWPS